jgi:hypothetical protein
MLTQSFLSRLLSLSKSSRLVFVLTIGFFGKTALIQADLPSVEKLKPCEIAVIAAFIQASNPDLVRKDRGFCSEDVFNFKNVKVVPKAYGPPDIPPIRA